MSQVPDREIASLYRSGMTMEAIATVRGTSISSVAKRLRSAGVESRRVGRPKGLVADYAILLGFGVKLKDAAEKLGEPMMRLSLRIYRGREFSAPVWRSVFPLTPDEIAIAREALDIDGLTFPDVIELIQDHRSLTA